MELDAWPHHSQYRPQEPVGIRVQVAGADTRRRIPVTVTIWSLEQVVTTQADEIETGPNGRADLVIWVRPPQPQPVPDGAAVGYAVEVIAGDPPTRVTTAFDVATHWSAAPRYGFCTDFSPDEDAAESDRRADDLLKLHVNVIQFYDWMASHHTFLPREEEFTDPLGRRLSHAVVRRKIELVRERGMAALAYGALYGAESDFSRAHADWLLYNGAGEPFVLADLFWLQDFSEASPWRAWIIGQYEAAIRELGFDGIHIDQYGFPKRARSRASGTWREIDVGAEFPGFVDAAARRLLTLRPDGGSIFNCVNAWPLEAMAGATADAATYIEVWDPHTTYRDLYELVRRARLIRPKQVILAAYLPPFGPAQTRTTGALNAFRLASAAIHASGGFHLIAGEGRGFLSEAYYPNYGPLTPDEFAVVRRYYDFVVRNTRLLHAQTGPDIAWTHVGPTNDVIRLRHPRLADYGAGARPDSLWVIGRESDGLVSLQLLNLRGIQSTAWNVNQPSPPEALEEVEVEASILGDIEGVWWDTPDDAVGLPRPLPFEISDGPRGRTLSFRIPRIDFWTAVWWQSSRPGRG